MLKRFLIILNIERKMLISFWNPFVEELVEPLVTVPVTGVSLLAELL